MKFIRLLILVSVLSTLIVRAERANAVATPASLNFVPPIEFPSSEYSVTGLRLSVLWGHHRDMYGLDLGAIGNITDNTFVGTAVSGIFNMTHGTTTVVGLQAAALANINTNKTSVSGLQLALVNVNTATSWIAGFQAGAANLSEFTDIYGAQLGIYNRANEVRGVQIGLVNVATNLHGVQIGLVNFNQKGTFFVSPILNVGF